MVTLAAEMSDGNRALYRSGMATGNWIAGYLYDIYGHYGPSFGVGVAFNVANFLLLAMLVLRQRTTPAGR